LKILPICGELTSRRTTENDESGSQATQAVVLTSVTASINTGRVNVTVKLIGEVKEVHRCAVVDISNQKTHSGSRVFMLLDANILFIRS